MEQFGLPDTIQVTESTYEFCKDTFPFQPRGEIEIKGKIKVNAFYFTPFLAPLHIPVSERSTMSMLSLALPGTNANFSDILSPLPSGS